MSGVRGADLVFYVLALVTLTGALGGALRRDARGASTSLLWSAAALGGIFAWLGAGVVAGLQGILVAAGILARRRGVSVSVDQGEAAGSRRWRGALIVVAFLVIATRAVAMARWPLLAASRLPSPMETTAAASSMLPAVSLLHCLVTALLLFAVGIFAVITRGAALGIAMGAEMMMAASALGIVAVTRFVASDSDGNLLAALVVASTMLGVMTSMFAGSRSGEATFSVVAARNLGNGVSVALAGVTLALLAGVW